MQMARGFNYAPALGFSLAAILGIGALVINADKSNNPARYEGPEVEVEAGTEAYRSRYASEPCGELAVGGLIGPDGYFGGVDSPESFTFDGSRELLETPHDCGDRYFVVKATEVQE